MKRETGPIYNIDPSLRYQVDRAVEELMGSHEATRGGTVSLARGDLAGLPLFAVAAFPKLRLKTKKPPTDRDVWHFVMQNLKLLIRPDRAVGIWFDTEQTVHDLDIVALFVRLDHALNVASRLGERFIYDLAARAEIDVREPLALAVATVFGLREGD